MRRHVVLTQFARRLFGGAGQAVPYGTPLLKISIVNAVNMDKR